MKDENKRQQIRIVTTIHMIVEFGYALGTTVSENSPSQQKVYDS